jgi:hypothetical protein
MKWLSSKLPYQIVEKFIVGVIVSGVMGAIGYATHQLVFVIPSVQAKVEKIDNIEVKMDKLNNNMIKVMTKLEID